MKRNMLSIATMALAGLLMTQPLPAQSRRGGNERGQSHSTTIRPSSRGNERHSRPSAPADNRPPTGHTRPGNSNIRPGTPNSRPGNSNVRPGNGNNHNFRPGNNDNNKPSVRPQKPQKPQPPKHPGKPMRPTAPMHPQRPSRPGFGHNRPAPVHRPGAGYRPGPDRPAYIRPAHRPGRPPMRPWTRPVPPPHWHPSYHGSLLGNILGLTFGVALNSALDNLYYGGYTIDGYMNNEVYLSGVSQFNYFWPDATLFFNNGGGLIRSQFFSPTIGYDNSRYYNLYANLCSNYGNPAIQNMAGTNLSATWFGANGDYISIQYTPMTSGNYRYFTVLTIGR